jgi:putative ABC transport system permease protein
MILSYRLARASLKSHRLRTCLTVLGVVIGVFIISLILIISSGLRKSITGQISALSGDIIVIRGNSDNSSGMEAFSPLKVAPITSLNSRDVAIVSQTNQLISVAPMMFLSGQASGPARHYEQINIVATSPNFNTVFNLKFSAGNWFNTEEVEKPWVILGDKLARGLLGMADLSGQTINLKGHTFTVIGILSRINQPISLAGVDIDKAAFISSQNGLSLSGGIDQVGQIAARAEPSANLTQLRQTINQALAENHNDNNEFIVRDGQDSVGALTGSLDIITSAALIFATISLLVGGIGIMNIMLVSVTERVREIGIRKAVGARRRQILNQFLIEALLMTLYGGVIGMLLAYGVSYLISLQFSLLLSFDWWIFVIGLGAPLMIGLTFGLWPAAKAARQDPISALRQLS